MIRKISKTVTGMTQYDGAGVKLVRVISKPDILDFDPFLMLDAFDSYDPEDYIKGFPWHPHRGIETVTYLIRGDIEHGDSLGNSGSILDGCCQWMTAGSGIIHQEMPKASERMLGVQLWLNMPAKDKMSSPAYRDIRENEVPVIRGEGVTVRVVSGGYQGTPGPAQGEYVKMLLLDVELAPGAKWTLDTDPGSTLFIYIVQGEGVFGESGAGGGLGIQKSALLFDRGEVFAASSDTGARFLLFAGRALKEPVAWGGPVVMNTKEELNLAFEEIRSGSFVKHGPKLSEIMYKGEAPDGNKQ